MASDFGEQLPTAAVLVLKAIAPDHQEPFAIQLQWNRSQSHDSAATDQADDGGALSLSEHSELVSFLQSYHRYQTMQPQVAKWMAERNVNIRTPPLTYSERKTGIDRSAGHCLSLARCENAVSIEAEVLANDAEGITILYGPLFAMINPNEMTVGLEIDGGCHCKVVATAVTGDIASSVYATVQAEAFVPFWVVLAPLQPNTYYRCSL